MTQPTETARTAAPAMNVERAHALLRTLERLPIAVADELDAVEPIGYDALAPRGAPLTGRAVFVAWPHALFRARYRPVGGRTNHRPVIGLSLPGAAAWMFGAPRARESDVTMLARHLGLEAHDARRLDPHILVVTGAPTPELASLSVLEALVDLAHERNHAEARALLRYFEYAHAPERDARGR